MGTNTVIIFVPSDVANKDCSYLHGDFVESSDYTKTFYIIRATEAAIENDLIGVYSFKPVKNLAPKENWVHIDIKNQQVSIKSLKIHGSSESISFYQIILIYYDFDIFLESEILLNHVNTSLVSRDHFKNLVGRIVSYKKAHNTAQLKSQVLQSLINFIIFILLTLHKKLLPLSKWSNVAVHLTNAIDGVIWMIEKVQKEKRISIKVFNFVFSTIVDMACGVLFLNWLTYQVSLDSSPQYFLTTAETVVSSLKNLLQWLTGDPAGLKLNMAFNKMLATFCLFHIDIWWTFLAFLKPALKTIFQIFLILGNFGITIQASIVADLLAFVSFHVYCIYAYAAKLYHVQISALMSLWRLFLGRKKNPLRHKVDSCQYSPEQLFIGTVAFTILLFLLPTTLVYYVVFTGMRVIIIGFGGILTRIRYFFHTLPIYSTWLWLTCSSKINSEIELVAVKTKSNILTLSVKPVSPSWWELVHQCRPECYADPNPFNCKKFISLLLSGELVYPF